MEKHLNVVAALHLGLSIIGLLVALSLTAILGLALSFVEEPEIARILPVVFKILVWVIVLLSLPGIVAGIGLFKRREWARILALVLSVIKILNVPIGTVVGVYSIWVLVHEETQQIFKPVLPRI